jgi:hypothetical protein
MLISMTAGGLLPMTWRTRVAGATALILALLHAAPTPAQEKRTVDVCVYGGTAGGVVAAAQVAKLGKSVLLIEPGRHLGGMTSGGLGQTDFGNKAIIGGLSRDFYRRLGKHYGQEEAWQFTPAVAEAVLRDLVKENKVEVLFEHSLTAVTKKGPHIESVRVEPMPAGAYNEPLGKPGKGPAVTVAAKVFLDASYEGDLMAMARVSYHVGREANAAYDETLNGIRPGPGGHHFTVKVDPYLKPGDPASGLLPLVQPLAWGKPGDGDRSVQAYNFRLCLTQDAANRLPWRAPPGYDPARYELAARYVEALAAAGKPPTFSTLFIVSRMPRGKTDINNRNAVSSDFIGGNYDYPDADYATRGKIWREHVHYQQGLLYFYATSPRVPEKLRQEVSSWGMCKDEFADTGGWPHQLYVREARRLVGGHVITEHDCRHKVTVPDPVGMGAYTMDSHNCRRLVRDGAVQNEGNVEVAPAGPYPISYRALTPKPQECDNLLVPVCLSSSHIAYGSARMEPVFMALGQSAAFAASQAIDEGTTVQAIDYPRLRRALLAAGQVLEYRPPPKPK